MQPFQTGLTGLLEGITVPPESPGTPSEANRLPSTIQDSQEMEGEPDLPPTSAGNQQAPGRDLGLSWTSVQTLSSRAAIAEALRDRTTPSPFTFVNSTPQDTRGSVSDDTDDEIELDDKEEEESGIEEIIRSSPPKPMSKSKHAPTPDVVTEQRNAHKQKPENQGESQDQQDLQTESETP